MSVPDVTVETVIAITDAVQAAIGAGDWQRASSLESDRRHALESLFTAAASSSGGVRLLEEQLASLQERNNKMIGELHHHRRRLVRDASTISTGRRAAREYETASKSR